MQKTLKHDRQNNGGKSSYDRVKNDLRRLFERNAAAVGELADSVFEYWENEYIHNSSELANEPTSDHIEKLAAMLSFLEGDDDVDALADNDWTELADIVRYEADDLPMDSLQTLMSTLVSKGAY